MKEFISGWLNAEVISRRRRPVRYLPSTASALVNICRVVRLRKVPKLTLANVEIFKIHP